MLSAAVLLSYVITLFSAADKEGEISLLQNYATTNRRQIPALANDTQAMVAANGMNVPMLPDGTRYFPVLPRAAVSGQVGTVGAPAPPPNVSAPAPPTRVPALPPAMQVIPWASPGQNPLNMGAPSAQNIMATLPTYAYPAESMLDPNSEIVPRVPLTPVAILTEGQPRAVAAPPVPTIPPEEQLEQKAQDAANAAVQPYFTAKAVKDAMANAVAGNSEMGEKFMMAVGKYSGWIASSAAIQKQVMKTHAKTVQGYERALTMGKPGTSAVNAAEAETQDANLNILHGMKEVAKVLNTDSQAVMSVPGMEGRFVWKDE